MGRGVRGRRIGCTQPRRIAATSVARRVADELQVELGNEVGYQIRFEDRTTRDLTSVKFMTDGILLAETRGDQELRQYDTLIIDEAHERSLNIDFILGYLHRLLPRRPDLKVVISSATLDAESFADFFDDTAIIEVEGRAFPVEDIYQPPLHRDERLAEQVARAAEELARFDPLGDTLVFLPGEREIRDVADLLEGRRYPNTIVLPLFARLAGKAQQAVFQPSRHKRRIILATNVAETSLTIPDIRSVIDSGIARVNRFDPRSGIQRLQIEQVSKASARQRRGRCGRVAEGICVRLYDEEDFEDRPEFTDPEILRSNLAGVVLQMEHLGLGDPLEFPFVDKPQPKRITEAYRTLEEIGAIWKKGRQRGLTDIGRTLARLPLDPRVGRMLLGGRVGGLPARGSHHRQRPDRAGSARAAAGEAAAGRPGAREIPRQALGLHELAPLVACRRVRPPAVEQFPAPLLPGELPQLPPPAGVDQPPPRAARDAARPEVAVARPEEVDRRSRRTPTASRSTAPSWPPSLRRSATTRARSRATRERPARCSSSSRDRASSARPRSGRWPSRWWRPRSSTPAMSRCSTLRGWRRSRLTSAATVTRTRTGSPRWAPSTARQSLLAFGLTLIDKRRIHYGRIDPEEARKIFILEALVNGETRSPLPVLARNRETIAAAERLEHKLRRSGGLVHPDAINAFYEGRVPKDVCTQKAFEQWAGGLEPGALDLRLDDCIIPQPEPIDLAAVPDWFASSDGESLFELSYLHNPADPADGITVRIHARRAPPPP